ncbi:hypothetical protein DWQ65_12955 [Treponema phagedenis]|uniref:Uncharacterized protein n=2 Tax=Treponema phagedenis TaxID=162 RepID=A0A0B7GVI7_TREPH|nr:hypothetical protein [Treponema phagedenis]NVP22678.1 hypothetical protein [Treponema phagedenis]QEJ98420.1 hypothetical protein FUT82_10700 [Treponema phagedenis]QEK03928.1 hypothetical protein FUT83_09010 [Treponema phagedenis]QEK09544.1 hypothetical protein FUT81_08920 [Treponema phagedenis]QKS92091.1 hypothetical protein HPJ96_05625 [Treponema phagedenis]
MTHTVCQYPSGNEIFLREALYRNEYIYSLKCFMLNGQFTTQKAALLKMRVLLACIEASAIVIDAYIQTEEKLSYLFVLCSSKLDSSNFSAIIRRYTPKALIEEMDEKTALHCLQNISVEALKNKKIPYIFPLNELHSSKECLLSLLIEYRALTAEMDEAFKHIRSQNSLRGLRRRAFDFLEKKAKDEKTLSNRRAENFLTDIVIFEERKRIASVAVFQIETINRRPHKSSLVIKKESGGGELFYDKLYCIKKIDFLSSRFTKRLARGLYQMEVPGKKTSFTVNFTVPSLFIL